jgi:hypothetical protein
MCGMKVDRRAPSTIELDGHHFCSQHCADAYAEECLHDEWTGGPTAPPLAGPQTQAPG